MFAVVLPKALQTAKRCFGNILDEVPRGDQNRAYEGPCTGEGRFNLFAVLRPKLLKITKDGQRYRAENAPNGQEEGPYGVPCRCKTRLYLVSVPREEIPNPVPNRCAGAFYVIPHGSKEVLDRLPGIDDGFSDSLGIYSRSLKHCAKKRVIALHEVDEVINQQDQCKDSRKDNQRFYIDAGEKFSYCRKPRCNFAEVQHYEQGAGCHGDEAEHIVHSAQLVRQPNHAVTHPVQNANHIVEGIDHNPADAVCQPERFVGLGKPKPPLVLDDSEGVGYVILDIIERCADFFGVIYEDAFQIFDGDFSVSGHIFKLAGRGAQPLVQKFDRFRRPLKELTDGFRVYVASGKRLIHRLHERGNILIRFAGRLEQHGGRVVEVRSLVHAGEQIAVSLYKQRDGVGRHRVRSSGSLCGRRDVVLDFTLFSQTIGRALDLVVDAGELLDHAIYGSEAESNADCAKQSRSCVFYASDRTIHPVNILLFDVEPKGNAEFGKSHQPSPRFREIFSSILKRLYFALLSVRL